MCSDYVRFARHVKQKNETINRLLLCVCSNSNDNNHHNRNTITPSVRFKIHFPVFSTRELANSINQVYFLFSRSQRFMCGPHHRKCRRICVCFVSHILVLTIEMKHSTIAVRLKCGNTVFVRIHFGFLMNRTKCLIVPH